MNLTFDERPPPSKISSLVDDDLVESPTMVRQVSYELLKRENIDVQDSYTN